MWMKIKSVRAMPEKEAESLAYFSEREEQKSERRPGGGEVGFRDVTAEGEPTTYECIEVEEMSRTATIMILSS